MTASDSYVLLPYMTVESCMERSNNVSSPPNLRSTCCNVPILPSTLRLTGLLSFMLADEMTTGSVTTTDAEKRVYAARSHSWNLQQKRFKDAFPEVSLLLPISMPYLQDGGAGEQT